jgi:hypothetical protein
MDLLHILGSSYNWFCRSLSVSWICLAFLVSLGLSCSISAGLLCILLSRVSLFLFYFYNAGNLSKEEPFRLASRE